MPEPGPWAAVLSARPLVSATFSSSVPRILKTDPIEPGWFRSSSWIVALGPSVFGVGQRSCLARLPEADGKAAWLPGHPPAGKKPYCTVQRARPACFRVLPPGVEQVASSLGLLLPDL